MRHLGLNNNLLDNIHFGILMVCGIVQIAIIISIATIIFGG